jgi:hypothetical protein
MRKRPAGICWSTRLRLLACALVASLLLGIASQRAAAQQRLPDLIAWANDSTNASRCYMYCGVIDTELIDNKVLYRFHGALPNLGVGPLEIREVTHPNHVQDVYQRIYQTQGGFNETLIGSFPITGSILPNHHLFLPGIAQYNLRTVLPGDGVGPIVSSHDKTSMAVVDSRAYDPPFPGAPPSSVYNSVSVPILGISIGWADVYTRALPGQWVEATGLADGQYWLEVIADPYDRIQELNESNNTTRILVNLVVPEPQILPGDYNGDDSVDAADYVVWRKTLGQSVSQGTAADGDGDGTIGTPDYNVWRANFGVARAGGGSDASAVPEPAGAVLAVIGALLLFFMPISNRFGDR